MGKEKITLPIGSSKALIFETDPANKDEQDFAKLCKEVAATKPQSIQEFFTPLNDLQQKKPPEASKKMSRRL